MSHPKSLQTQLLSPSRGQRLSPLLLLFVVFCFWFSLYTYPSILTPYLEGLDASHSFAGVVVGSYGFTQMLLRLPAGVFSDKLRRKKIFVSAGLFFSLISAVGFIWTQNLWLILMLRAMAGVAAAMWVQMSTLYLSYHQTQDSWAAMGRVNFANTFATTVATLVGGTMANRWGWTYAFVPAAAVAAIGLIASLFLHEERLSPSDDLPATSFRESFSIGRDRLLLLASVAALLAQLVTFSTAQGFVPVFAKNLGARTDQIALMATLATLPRAIASLFGGRMAGRKRTTAAQLVAFGFLINGTMIAVLPLISNFTLLIVTQMLAGFGSGLQMTLLMGLCTQNIASDKKSTAMGFYQAVYGIGMVIGPVVVGAISDLLSLNAAFILISAISFASLFLVRLLKQESLRD